MFIDLLMRKKPTKLNRQMRLELSKEENEFIEFYRPSIDVGSKREAIKYILNSLYRKNKNEIERLKEKIRNIN